jgi:hypothetical protein
MNPTSADSPNARTRMGVADCPAASGVDNPKTASDNTVLCLRIIGKIRTVGFSTSLYKYNRTKKYLPNWELNLEPTMLHNYISCTTKNCTVTLRLLMITQA